MIHLTRLCTAEVCFITHPVRIRTAESSSRTHVATQGHAVTRQVKMMPTPQMASNLTPDQNLDFQSHENLVESGCRSSKIGRYFSV